jgi:hypothetical protein
MWEQVTQHWKCWNEWALSAQLGLGQTSMHTLLSMLHYICMLYVPCNTYTFASWAHQGQMCLPVLPQQDNSTKLFNHTTTHRLITIRWNIEFQFPTNTIIARVLYHSNHKFTRCYVLPHELAQSVVHGPLWCITKFFQVHYKFMTCFWPRNWPCLDRTSS